MIDYILQADQEILLWIQMYIRHESITPFFRFITHLGDKGIIWIIISVMLLIRKDTRRAGFLSLISLAFSYILVNLFLKNYVARIRPYEYLNELELLIERQRDFSFPSGHASSSFATAVILFQCLKKRTGILALALASMISFSRLYIGVHYPTDVIIGIIIGTIVAILVYQISNKIKIEHIKKNLG